MKIQTCVTVAYFVSTLMTSCLISASPNNTKRPVVSPRHFPRPVEYPDPVNSNILINALDGIFGSQFDKKLKDLENHIRHDSKEMESRVNKNLDELKKLMDATSEDVKAHATSEVQRLDRQFDTFGSEVEKKMKDLENHMKTYATKSEVRRLESMFEEISAHINENIEYQMKTSQTQDEMLKAEDKKIENLSKCTSPKAAFTATLEQGKYKLSKDVSVKYKNVLLNENGDYNQETGVFTAKEPGLYLFTVHVTGKWERDAELYIAYNDQKVTSTEVYGDLQNRNAASTDALLQLNVGDTVQVKPLRGDWNRELEDKDGTVNSFSGVLIRSDACNV